MFEKNFGSNLKNIDISEYSDKFSEFGNDCVNLISYKCPNVVNLNLSRLVFSNKPFAKAIKYCRKIKEINLTHCTKVHDATLTRMLQKCASIESINVSFCYHLTGSFFESANGNLISVTIDGCDSV